jgi:hypothetical protein
MTIKLEASAHNLTGSDLWLEYSNIRETTLVVGETTLVSALCDWRIHDKDSNTVYSPDTAKSYSKVSILPTAYANWDRTEAHFGALLIAYLTPIVLSA